MWPLYIQHTTVGQEQKRPVDQSGTKPKIGKKFTKRTTFTWWRFALSNPLLGICLSQPKFLPSNGFLAPIAISFVTIPSSFSSPASYVIITQSWRNRGVTLETICFHGQSLQVQFYFKGLPLQNSVSSVISFQVFIPLNVSIFLLSFTLIRIYAQF